MKSKGLFMVIVLMSLAVASPSFSAPYFVYDQYGGTWQDANKSGGDGNMCWAAAASNALAWGGWGTSSYPAAAAIFQNFKDNWMNVGGVDSDAWKWWINGTPSGGLKPTATGGNYWPGTAFTDYFHEKTAYQADIMQTVDTYLHNGYGVSISIGYPDIGGHSLSVWGFDYADGKYTAMYVTDSNGSLSELVRLELTYDSVDNWWHVGSGGVYPGWFIGGVQALDRNPYASQPAIPEPSTLILFIAGILGIGVLRAKLRR